MAERLRPTLGLRLAVWYAALFTVSAIALTVLTYFLLSTSLQHRDRELVLGLLRRYVVEYSRGGVPRLNDAIEIDRAAGRHEQLLVRVLDPRARALFYSLPANWSDFDLTGLDAIPRATGETWMRLPSRRRHATLEVASVVLRDGTLFQAGTSSENRIQILERFRAISSLILASIVMIGLAGGAALTWRGMQPVRLLAATVGGIVQTGQLSARVPVRASGDPLDELGVLFNGMLDRLEALIGGMRGALDNVAHDLRTPMTRVRGIAEAALAEGRDPDALREALADCVEELDRVAGMLDAVMDISEAETGALALRTEAVPLSALLEETADLYADVADEKKIQLRVEAAPGVSVTADRNRLRQALANLVDNAIKYTPAGGSVELRAALRGDRAVIEVRDTGVGIPAADLPRIWDRLYRGDKSRSERGLGLGLSLVRAIVHAHHGEARVESEPDRGSTFTIELPITTPDSPA